MAEIPPDARAVLDRPNIAHIATVLPDGAPRVVPTWVTVLVEPERIVIHDFAKDSASP
jgi:Pyridoxamine 5'-phosphate oxidase